MKRTALVRWLPFRLAAFVAPLIAAWPARTQAAVVTWDGGTAGTSQSWLTAASWAGDVAPVSTDIASFAAAGSPTSNQIGAAGNVTLQALQVQSTRTLDLTIGNSSTTTNFTLTLNGGTVNSVANTVLSYERTGGTLNINNTSAGGSGTGRSFNVVLGNATDNIFSVAGGGTVNMNTVITGASRKLTKDGAGVLVLSQANTYSGAVTVRNTGTTGASTLRISNATALGTGTTVDVLTGGAAAGQGTTLDIRGNITVAAGKTLTLNSNTTGDFRTTFLNGADNNTWNSNIVAAGTGLVQVNAAAGTTLTIGGTVTSSGGGGTGTLFARGTGTVIYNGVLNLGTDRLFNRTDGGTVIVNSTGNSWLRSQSADGQIQIGANNALAAVEFSLGQSSGTNGRLELNGFNQTVTRLNSWGGNTAHTGVASSGTNHIIRNSNLSAASTLTWSTPAGVTDLLNNVNVYGGPGGQGTLHMVKNGDGRTEFRTGALSANSWTVNAGTLAFDGTNNRTLAGDVTGVSGTVIEKTGTGNVTATGAWNHAGETRVIGGTLGLAGGTAGNITVSDGATLSTGVVGGVLSAGTVTLGSAGATTFVPVLSTPGSAAGLNAATLTPAGTTVTVAPLGTGLTLGTYKLIDYATLNGNGFSGFALAPLGSYPHMTAALVDNTADGRVDLSVTALDSLIWTGNSSGTWDVNATSNFALASATSTPSTFYTGDSVLFADASDVPAPGTSVVNRTITGGAVSIGTLTFDNTTSAAYSVANPLGGAGNIVKNNTGTVTLSGANNYQGTTAVNGGTLVLSGANNLASNVTVASGATLRIGNSEALRGAPTVTVAAGGTFDAAGIAVGNRVAELIVGGAGVGGNGAIMNSGAGITNNSHFAKYTLTGDTTWGGAGRYDVVTGQIFNGGGYTLTKVGAGELWFNPGAGTALGDVIVNGGTFGSQGTNPLAATSTVTVNTGALHSLYGNISQQHKAVLNDGGTLRGSNGTAVFNGQVTLNGTDTNRFLAALTGTALTVNGKVTGTGGFTKNDAGTVNLANAGNDYAGDTKVTAGTLNIQSAAVIPATTNLIVDGGTFGTGNVARTVASLSGAGGTISGGNTLTTTQSTTTAWAGTLSGTTLQMSGIGSLALGGTADNSAGVGILNSGTFVLEKGSVATPAPQGSHSFGSGFTMNGGTTQIGGVYNNTSSLGTGVNLAPLGINTATYVDQIYNAVTVNLNAGILDLNGRQEAINGLANPTGAGGTVTNTSSAAALLFVGHQGATAAFGGGINNGTGVVSVEKLGTGTQTFSGTSNFTGGYTQTAGNTVLSGAFGATPITVNAGNFALNGTHGNAAIAVSGTGTLSGNGTTSGTVTPASGGIVLVGTASAGTTAATLTAGGLTLGGGVNLNLDFDTAGTTVDKVATTNANGLSVSGANNLNVVLGGSGWVPGTYPILTYSGAVQGAGASGTTLVLSTPVGHSSVTVVDNLAGAVNLVVSGSANKWVGGAAGNPTLWDTNSTLNWNAPADQKFLTGDTVVFDDTAVNFSPNITVNQTASGVTFDNTTAYTLTSTGAFGIAGTAGLIKKNSGTATISSVNTYTGTTDVQAGTLIANFNPAGTQQAVFATASTINVAGGATFKAIGNDGNVTLANNLTGTGLVVIDPHATAAAGVRDVSLSGNNAGFTGTLRLAPTTDVASGLGTFRTNALTQAHAGGATVDVDAGGQAWLSGATFANNFILSGQGYAETAGATPAAVSGLTAYSGAVKGGIGALRMDNGAVINGSVTLDGTAKIGAYTATGTINGRIGITNSSDKLVVGGGGANTALVLGGANNTGVNALNEVVVNSGSTSGSHVLQIGNNGTAGTLGTGAVTLYNDAGGAILRIHRSDGYTMAQNVTAVADATANLARARFVSNTTGTGLSLGGYSVDLSDGVNGGNVAVAGYDNTAPVNGAILNIDLNSSIDAGSLQIGESGNFGGTVNQSGTSTVTLLGQLRVGHWGTETSTYNMSGGSLTLTGTPASLTAAPNNGQNEQNGVIYLGIDGTGFFNQTGGSVSASGLVLDNRPDTAAGANMPSGTDRYSLEGGTLSIGAFGVKANPTSEFSFGGGTYKATASHTIEAAVPAKFSGTGGASTVNTNGFTITAANAWTGAGSLIKDGTGTLVMSGANTYTGPTTVKAGTLLVTNASGSATGTGASADVTVDANGTLAGYGTIAGDVALAGTLRPGQSGVADRTLTIQGNVTTTAGSVIHWNVDGEAAGQADMLEIASGSTIDISGSSFSMTLSDTTVDLFEPGEDWSTQASNYQIIAGTFSGMFANAFYTDMTAWGLSASEPMVSDGTRNYWVRTGSMYLVPVPEAGTGALALLAGLGLAARRRRRN